MDGSLGSTSSTIFRTGSGMLHLHYVYQVTGYLFGVGLLDELGEDALKVFEFGELGELARSGVGDDLALVEDDDAVADTLDNFENVGDVEDGFAFAGEQDEKVFEEARGDSVEAGKRFVEDEQGGVVHERGGEQDALLHSLGVVGDGRVLGALKREELEQAAGFGVDELFRHSTKTADELEVFEAGEVGVDLRFFGDVAETGAEGGEIFMDVAAVEEDFAVGGLDHASDHLDGGGFAGAVGAEVAEDFAFGKGKADILDGGDGAIALGGVFDFEHGPLFLVWIYGFPPLPQRTRQGWGTPI